MGVVVWIVIAVTVVVVVTVVSWMFVTHTPEQAATHQIESEPRPRLTDDLARGVDRPADPNAEAQGVVAGDARAGPPGPSTAPSADEGNRPDL